MFNKFKTALVLGMALVLGACASTQEAVPFSQNIDKNKKIGVMYVEPVKAETGYTGQIGLLDYGIISAVNAGLDKHLKAQVFDEYQALPQQLTDALNAKGYQANLVTEAITRKVADKFKTPSKNINKTDFSKYKEAHGIDYLVLVDMPSIGTTRSYYGPVPTSEPLASARVQVQMVDLNNGAVVWFNNAYQSKVIEMPWDESDGYPNLTNAVYTNLHSVVQVILQDVNRIGSAPSNQKVAEITPNKL